MEKISEVAKYLPYYLWSIFVLVLFFVIRPEYYLSFTENAYWPSILTCLSLGLGYHLLQRKIKVFNTGFAEYAMILVFMSVISGAFMKHVNAMESISAIEYISYVKSNISIHFAFGFIIIACHGVGNLISTKLIEQQNNSSEGAVVNIGVGICAVIGFMFLLGLFSLLSKWILIPACLLAIFVPYRASWQFVKTIFGTRSEMLRSDWIGSGLRVYTLILLSFLFVGAYKIIPTGFDSSALYQNVSSNIFQSGALVAGLQPYNWSLFTSLGPLMFGKMEISIFMSHAAILLVLWSTAVLSGKISKGNNRVKYLTVALVVSSPLVFFLGMVDSKVDLGFTFLLLVTAILGIRWNGLKQGTSTKIGDRLILLMGLLLGVSMGVKFLAVFGLIAAGGMIMNRSHGILAYIGWLCFSIALLLLLGIDKFAYLDLSLPHKSIIIGVFLVSAFIMFFQTSFFSLQSLKSNLKPFIILGFSFLLGFGNWIIKNSVENKTLSLTEIISGKAKIKQQELNYQWLTSNGIPLKLREKDKQYMLSAMAGTSDEGQSDGELYANWEAANQDFDKSAYKASNLIERRNSGYQEEILRYLGYESTFLKYLSIPFDVSYAINISKRGNIVGILFLLFLPMMFWYFLGTNSKKRYSYISFFLFLIVIFMSILGGMESQNITLASDFLAKTRDIKPASLLDSNSGFSYALISSVVGVSNLLSPITGLVSKIPFIVTMLILSGFILSLLYFVMRSLEDSSKRNIFLFAFSFSFLWFWFGNAISYYNMASWILLTVLVSYWLHSINSFRPLQGFLSGVVGVVLFCSLIFNFTGNANDFSSGKQLYTTPFIYQGFKNVPSKDAINKLMPDVKKVKAVFNSRVEDKVYRVGTFVHYLIPNNAERVIVDNQLNFFGKASDILEDPNDFIDVLRTKNVKYVVFDFKTGSIDKTQEKSLQSKVSSFVKVLNQEGVKLLYTDRVVQVTNPTTGKLINLNGLKGKIVSSGTMAIFDINADQE